MSSFFLSFFSAIMGHCVVVQCPKTEKMTSLAPAPIWFYSVTVCQIPLNVCNSSVVLLKLIMGRPSIVPGTCNNHSIQWIKTSAYSAINLDLARSSSTIGNKFRFGICI